MSAQGYSCSAKYQRPRCNPFCSTCLSKSGNVKHHAFRDPLPHERQAGKLILCNRLRQRQDLPTIKMSEVCPCGCKAVPLFQDTLCRGRAYISPCPLCGTSFPFRLQAPSLNRPCFPKSCNQQGQRLTVCDAAAS